VQLVNAGSNIHTQQSCSERITCNLWLSWGKLTLTCATLCLQLQQQVQMLKTNYCWKWLSVFYRACSNIFYRQVGCICNLLVWNFLRILFTKFINNCLYWSCFKKSLGLHFKVKYVLICCDISGTFSWSGNKTLYRWSSGTWLSASEKVWGSETGFCL